MSYYLLKFDKKGRSAHGASEKMMIESASISGAKECADVAARKGGSGKAVLKLFNEIGLVAIRTPAGVWSG